MVASWPLDVPLSASELFPFCVPARSGPVHSHVNENDASVQTVMEIPSCPQTEGGYYFKLTGIENGTRPDNRPLTQQARSISVEKRVSFETESASAPLIANITNAVRKTLTPSKASLAPYKISIYCPGNFFKARIDSPTLSNARVLGTAVVALPSAFSGGELRVHAPAGHIPIDAPFVCSGRATVASFDWVAAAKDEICINAPLAAGAATRDTVSVTEGAILPWAAFTYDCDTKYSL